MSSAGAPSQPPPPSPPARPPRALFLLLSVVIVDLVGFGIVMPVLPFYAETYGAGGTLLGLLFSGYAAMQFLFAPIWGRLADRFGRRRVLLGTIAGTGVSLLGLGLADSLVGVFAARLLAGAFAANVTVASAYIADVTDESERTRWMGLLGACFGIGFLIGPAVGGLLSPFGHGVPMLAAAGLAGVNLVHAAVSLPEPPRHRPAAGTGAPRAGVLRTLSHPEVRRLCAVNLAFALAVTQLETMFAFFVNDHFGTTALGVGLLLAAMALLMGAVQGGGIRPLVARFGERRLVLSGLGMLAASMALFPTAPTLAWLVPVLALGALGRAVGQPAMMGLVSFAGDPSQRGAVMGTFQAAASLARVVGPGAAGLLYDLRTGAPFLMGAVLLAIAVALAFPLRTARAPQPQAPAPT